MRRLILFVLFINIVSFIHAQTIDKIAAIVGDEMVLLSEIETNYLQYISQGNIDTEEMRCIVIEELLIQSLLINQAKIDSVVISNEDIDSEVDKRIGYFENQLGSIEKMEEYFGKKYTDIKSELSKVIKKQMYDQNMRQNITSNIKLTPAEVQSIYLTLAKDDIPLIPSQVELLQIVITPTISEDQEQKIKDKLNSFRERVYAGEDFKMFASLYSDDITSASSGGELGFVNRGELVPEFERAAFKLKEGEISEIIQTKYGLHIIQLIERRGEQVNVRHILMKLKPNSTAKLDAKMRAQDIFNQISSGKIIFEDAVKEYSDHDSKNNHGLLTNLNDMSTMYRLEDLPYSLASKVKDLEVGQFINAGFIEELDSEVSYRIFMVNKKIESHVANLKDDFTTINNIATNLRRQEVLNTWVKEKLSSVYVNLSKDIKECNYKNNWNK